MTFWYALAVNGSVLWWVGVLVLAAAVLFSFSAFYGQLDRQERLLQSNTQEPERRVPLLGDMLLDYNRVSYENLKRALDRQRGTTIPLGQILVEMELITPAELDDLLEEQHTRKRRQLRWRGPYRR